MSKNKPSKPKIIAPEEPESVIRPEQDIAGVDEQKEQLAGPDVAAVMVMRTMTGSMQLGRM